MIGYPSLKVLHRTLKNLDPKKAFDDYQRRIVVRPLGKKAELGFLETTLRIKHIDEMLMLFFFLLSLIY